MIAGGGGRAQRTGQGTAGAREAIYARSGVPYARELGGASGDDVFVYPDIEDDLLCPWRTAPTAGGADGERGSCEDGIHRWWSRYRCRSACCAFSFSSRARSSSEAERIILGGVGTAGGARVEVDMRLVLLEREGGVGVVGRSTVAYAAGVCDRDV